MPFYVKDVVEFNDTTSENGVFRISPKQVTPEGSLLVELDHKDNQAQDTQYDFTLALNHKEMRTMIAAFEKFMMQQEQEQSALIQERQKDEAKALHGKGVD